MYVWRINLASLCLQFKLAVVLIVATPISDACACPSVFISEGLDANLWDSGLGSVSTSSSYWLPAVWNCQSPVCSEWTHLILVCFNKWITHDTFFDTGLLTSTFRWGNCSCGRTYSQTEVFLALFCHRFTIPLKFNKRKIREFKPQQLKFIEYFLRAGPILSAFICT